ncbi:DUF4344 domain-containing metallopeptidase [Falsihalocynthiibacter sp. S25ZX9]|uniref:DUF4344 domain-containing metallopeptidase n=1 Tax=Falsihalocynthiibacter sp. S25ZX9 TaxID=3240870 RepID=UPI00350FB966
MKKLICASILAPFLVTFAGAEENLELDSMVSDNLVATLYHEFGHGVIALWDLPIYGREEDAADNLSALMIDRLYDSDVSEDVIRSVAMTFAASAETDDADFPYWDVHGTNSQRFYNTVCIYYGLDPENRQAFAGEMDLPEDRADGCEDEALLVTNSWGAILDEMEENGPGDSFSYRGSEKDDPFLASVIQSEVDALNAMFSMDFELPVIVEDCGEVNAFFSSDTGGVTMCTEYEPYTRDQLSHM